MISSEALHLGPLMLPWTLIILLVALLGVSIVAHLVSRKLNWDPAIFQVFQDSLWTSVLIGLIGARMVFIMLHWDAYSTSMIDIFKIQDKGFHLIGGALFGLGWFFWKNKGLAYTSRLSFVFIFTLLLGTGIALQASVKQETHFPDLSFSSLNQTGETAEQIALQQFAGQPTVINMWASWCPPCHREMPVLQRAHDQYPDIYFIMLNQGEDGVTVRDYLKRYQLDFKHVLLDPYGELPQQLNMFGLPSTLFFNAQGQLVERHMGELSPAMLQHYLSKISLQP
ncbi:TlpA disulfide reductase family protein [Acinetobacter sp. RF14B]|uniref:TlpA disulfide reductase family protein n=1 Tax=Acinetobacter sp. RF14B TaxID=2650965 RepID=UPI00116CD1E0|nr:TlpA disulfide reductase family protein [Acinetobacter sp. RF14B]TQR73076.1 TlpA family protein disulfide reductase [Acinetobacter sp. RF14B]